jgi:hypothetical protein
MDIAKEVKEEESLTCAYCQSIQKQGRTINILSYR